MIYMWLQLAFMLVIILFASQLFTNALEHFSHKMGLSAGVTGSILAAVATALPETIIPILAIFAGGADKIANHEIGVGAILGAPLMLSTLSIAIMALSVLKKRGIRGIISPEKSGFVRDINFFLLAFFLAWVALYIPPEIKNLRALISVSLIGVYIFYLYSTVKASKKLVKEGHGVIADESLYLSNIGLQDNNFILGIQILLSLGLLVWGAHGFIAGIEHVAKALSVSVLVLSILIIPIATELPEKLNSIIWIRKHKDTLAFGNITGAMVFQGTLLPALGISFTSWQPNKVIETGILITYIAALWLRIAISTKGLSIWELVVNGVLYLVYLGIIF
jgi:cation:H+ antiporter